MSIRYSPREVQKPVMRRTGNNQVLDSVIESITVYVMNDFFWKWLKRSTKMPLHDNSVFKYLFAIYGNNFVTLRIYRAASGRTVKQFEMTVPTQAEIVCIAQSVHPFVKVMRRVWTTGNFT